MRAAALVLPLAVVLLSGCASSPEAEVRQEVRAVLAAANDEDAVAVRGAVDDLLATLRSQVGSGELTDAQAAPVRDAALAIRDSVAGLEAEESPTPSPEQSESPSPEPEPEPTQEPEPTPEPTQEPTPEPTQEPEPTTPAETPEPPQTATPGDDGDDSDDGGDGGDGGEDDQATVVPQQPALPAVSATVQPTPTA